MLRMMRQHQADTLSGISTFRDSGSGRPPTLYATAKEAISELLQKRRRDQKALNRAEFQSIVLEEVEQTSKRRKTPTFISGIEKVQEEYGFVRESCSAKNKRKDRC